MVTFAQVSKIKIPKGVDRLLFKCQRVDLHSVLSTTEYIQPAGTSSGANQPKDRDAVSETPTAAVVHAKSRCVPVPSQRIEQHMGGLGFLPPVRSGQHSACDPNLCQCLGDNDFHSKGSEATQIRAVFRWELCEATQ